MSSDVIIDVGTFKFTHESFVSAQLQYTVAVIRFNHDAHLPIP